MMEIRKKERKKCKQKIPKRKKDVNFVNNKKQIQLLTPL